MILKVMFKAINPMQIYKILIIIKSKIIIINHNINSKDKKLQKWIKIKNYKTIYISKKKNCKKLNVNLMNWLTILYFKKINLQQ